MILPVESAIAERNIASTVWVASLEFVAVTVASIVADTSKLDEGSSSMTSTPSAVPVAVREGGGTDSGRSGCD
jgi:hypothetical protein